MRAGAGFGILLAICTHTVAGAAELKVLSTNGLRGVLAKLGPDFERQSGHKVTAEYGAGPALKTRIENGEAFDLAILPLDFSDLIRAGRIVRETRSTLGRTGYGAAVRKGAPKPDVGTVDSLKSALLAAKAVAYAGEGVSGTYFLNLLRKLGISEQMQTKIKPMSAEAGSMAAVASSEADVAIGGIAVIVSAPGVELAGWLPHEVQTYLVFTAGVSGTSKDKEASLALLNLLKSPGAVPVFKSAGIEPVTP